MAKLGSRVYQLVEDQDILPAKKVPLRIVLGCYHSSARKEVVWADSRAAHKFSKSRPHQMRIQTNSLIVLPLEVSLNCPSS
jgi:hypothetical protein